MARTTVHAAQLRVAAGTLALSNVFFWGTGGKQIPFSASNKRGTLTLTATFTSIRDLWLASAESTGTDDWGNNVNVKGFSGLVVLNPGPQSIEVLGGGAAYDVAGYTVAPGDYLVIGDVPEDFLQAIGIAPVYSSSAKIGDYLRAIQNKYGSVKILPGGDSIMTGNDYNQGVRLPMVVGMLAEGITPETVGEDSGGGAEYLLQDAYGGQNVMYHQSKGGLTVAQWVAGSAPLSAWSATLLRTLAPDLIVLALGTNGTVQTDVDAVFAAVKAYNPDCPVVWITPTEPYTLSQWYYDRDSTRESYRKRIRDSARAAGCRTVIIDGAQAIGMYARYPINGAPAKPASTDTGAETVTFNTDPGWFSGQCVTPESTVGGLTAGTDYFVNRASSGTYSFHTTRANGVSGASKVNLTASITSRIFPRTNRAQNIMANAMSDDGTHPTLEANAMLWSAAHAQIFGGTPYQAMAKLCSMQPYTPKDLAFGADIAAAASLTPDGQSLARKTILTSLTVYNTDASVTATITILRNRRSPDSGPTVTAPITAGVFKIPAGATRGKSWNADQLAALMGGPIAHYNEEWSFAVAGATCNVEAQFKETIG